VTTTEALADQLVAPAIAGLRQAHPELQLDLMVGVRSLDIARREADLAVRFARPSVSELICRKLGEVGFSLYASERYLAKVGVPKRGQGLAGCDLITFTGAPAAMRSAAITRSSSSRLQRMTSVSQSLPALLVILRLIWSACALRKHCTSDCVADRASRYAPIGSDQGGFGRDYRSVPPPAKDVGNRVALVKRVLRERPALRTFRRGIEAD